MDIKDKKWLEIENREMLADYPEAVKELHELIHKMGKALQHLAPELPIAVCPECDRARSAVRDYRDWIEKL